MDINQRGILNIIKSALTDCAYTLPQGFNFEEAVTIAKKHEITTMIYYGALKCGIPSNTAFMAEMFTEVCKHISVSEYQIYQIKRLYKAFDDAGIRYLPLKGALLKFEYPKSEMRVMSDADILIQIEQYNEIKKIMESLGYTEGVESNHEYVWHNPPMHIELHKLLIPSYNKDYFSYYGDGWRLAKSSAASATRYEMNDEDQMIYLFTHFSKHYRDGGIGIRHLVDLWVFLDKHSSLNQDYLKKELKKLQLYNFYKNIIRTLNVWFNDSESDELSDFITDKVFQSGQYGTHEAHLLSGAYKETKSGADSNQARNKKYWSYIFLPYRYMSEKFPILVKFPFLLPIMWVVRIVETLIFKRNKVISKSKDFHTLSKDKIQDYGQALDFVGLNFNFKE